MADEYKQRQGMSTNTIIGYIRAFVFLALGSFLLTRAGYQFQVVGALFVIYGFWRVYSAYKRSRVTENEENSDE